MKRKKLTDEERYKKKEEEWRERMRIGSVAFYEKKYPILKYTPLIMLVASLLSLLSTLLLLLLKG